MKKFTAPFAGLILCCAMGSAFAQTGTTTAPSSAAPMTAPMATTSDSSAYKDQKDQIKASYKTSMSQCDSMTDNAKDVCKEQAKADRDKAEAKLKSDQHPSPRNTKNLADVSAKAGLQASQSRNAARRPAMTRTCARRTPRKP